MEVQECASWADVPHVDAHAWSHNAHDAVVSVVKECVLAVARGNDAANTSLRESLSGDERGRCIGAVDHVSDVGIDIPYSRGMHGMSRSRSEMYMCAGTYGSDENFVGGCKRFSGTAVDDGVVCVVVGCGSEGMGRGGVW